MRTVSLLVWALGLACFCAVPAQAEKISFQSYEPGDHQKIFSGNWQSGAFTSKAEFIPGSNPTDPLVIYNPGWGGTDKSLSAFKDITSRLGAKFQHLILSHPDNVDLAGRTVTIFQAVRAVKERGSNPSRIFVVGASGGGQEGIQTTHTKVAASLGGGEIHITGVIAFYPSCRVSYEDNAFNGTPILMFVGGMDKTAPADLCYELKDKRGLGSAQIVAYPNAGHSWLFESTEKTQRQSTWGDCRITIDTAGVWHGKGYDSKKGIGPLLKGMGKKCRKKVNMKVGRNNKAYRDSIDRAVEFIRSF